MLNMNFRLLGIAHLTVEQAIHFHLKRDMCYKTHDMAIEERIGLKTLSRNTYFRNVSLRWDFLCWHGRKPLSKPVCLLTIFAFLKSRQKYAEYVAEWPKSIDQGLFLGNAPYSLCSTQMFSLSATGLDNGCLLSHSLMWGCGWVSHLLACAANSRQESLFHINNIVFVFIQ